MSNIINISDHVPNEKDKYFFDTNIWMYLYCSVGNYDEQIVEKYNSFYERILESKASIYTTAMQLSEFFNTYCRLEYKLALEHNPKLDYKKHFRKSRDFKILMSHLKLIIQNRICKNALKMNDNFTEMNISNILKTGKEFDFNDEYFIELCMKESIVMVSNDYDIINHSSDIQVITALG